MRIVAELIKYFCAILGRYYARHDRSDLYASCGDHIKDSLAVVLMSPVMRIGLYLRANKIVRSDKLYTGFMHLLIVVNGTIRNAGTSKK